MGIAAGITSGVIGLTPYKTECFSAHSLAGQAVQDGLAVLRIKGLEALCQTDLAEVRRTLNCRRFGQIRTFLRRSHDVPVSIEL